MAEWGQLLVPENRQNDDSRLIHIPFVRFPSTAVKPGTPIVFLQGGPGGSPLSGLAWLWAQPMFRPPTDIADIIFIEHRGCGLARPCLDFPGTNNVPLSEPGSLELYREAHRAYLAQAISFWQEQGIELAGYNVRQMAADIDDLRQALGYDRVSLLGGSFGSHHGLALLRYYAPFIERVLLWSIEGPDHTIKLPSNVQKHLEKLDIILRQDKTLHKHIPNLLVLIASVLDKLERQPVTVETQQPQTREAVTITLGKYDLQLATANGMGNVPFLQALPGRYWAMAQGNFSWLAEQIVRERIGVKSNLMIEMVDYASGATAVRRQQIAHEAPGTLLGDAINEPFHALADVLGQFDLGDDFRSELHSSVPTLLIGGSLDTRTPISNAEEVLQGLSQGQLLTIEGVSHDLARRGDHIEALVRCRDRFFRGEEIGNQQLHSTFAFDPL